MINNIFLEIESSFRIKFPQIENGYEFKWQHTATGITSMLLTHLNIAKNTKNEIHIINEVGSNGGISINDSIKLFQNAPKYLKKSFELKEKRTIEQYFYYCEMFNIFDNTFSDISSVKGQAEMLKVISKSPGLVKYSKSFINSSNPLDYLEKNLLTIYRKQINIIENDKTEFRNDLINTLFTIYLFAYSEWNDFDHITMDSIFDHYKKKQKNSWKKEKGRQKFIVQYINNLFSNEIVLANYKSEFMTVQNESLFVRKNNSEQNSLVGYYGEKIFNYLIKNRNEQFEHLTNKFRLFGTEIGKVIWTSKDVNKFSPFDFQVGSFFVEVKSTPNSESNSPFYISNNELKKFNENRDKYLICRISGVKTNELIFEDGDFNSTIESFLKLVEKVEIKFINYTDLFESGDFSILPQNYLIKSKKI